MSLLSPSTSFYTPSTVGSLDRAASLAYDFQKMKAYLVGTTRDDAKAIYEFGAYCRSYAELSLDSPLTQDIPKGVVVKGMTTSSSNGEVDGRILRRASAGATTLKVQYPFTETAQSGPSLCSVGGNPTPLLDQCFKSTGQIQVSFDDSSTLLTLNYSSYLPLESTKNALTLEQLSLEMLTLPSTNEEQQSSHFQKVFQSYVKYYGSADYGNKWIQAAFEQITTNMDNGNGSFSIFSNPQDVNAAISLGTLTMNVWMHVGRTMDNAIQHCRSSSTSTGSSQPAPSLYDWDDAMAFYAGTMGASDGSLSQLYGLADQYCQWFGTCHNQKTTGRAVVNQDILSLWELGTQHLLDKDCDMGEQVVRKIMAQMTIPLVQGLLYHTYELDVRQQHATNQAMKVEAATFAAALLPMIHQCNPGNAASIYHNTKLTVEGSLPSFHVIKGALERQYDCLGITCEHVGGIVDIGNPSEFVAFAAPCDSDTKDVDDGNNGASMSVPTMNQPHHNRGLKVGMTACALLIGALIGLIWFYVRRGRCFQRPRNDEKEFDSAVVAVAPTTTVAKSPPQGDTSDEPDIELDAEML